MAGDKTFAASQGVVPMEIHHSGPLAVCSIRDMAASSVDKLGSVTASSSFPNVVKLTCRVVLSNSRKPTWRDNSRFSTHSGWRDQERLGCASKAATTCDQVNGCQLS